MTFVIWVVSYWLVVISGPEPRPILYVLYKAAWVGVPAWFVILVPLTGIARLFDGTLVANFVWEDLLWFFIPLMVLGAGLQSFFEAWEEKNTLGDPAD